MDEPIISKVTWRLATEVRQNRINPATKNSLDKIEAIFAKALMRWPLPHRKYLADQAWPGGAIVLDYTGDSLCPVR